MAKVLICPNCSAENSPWNMECSTCHTSFVEGLQCPKCGERTPTELGECILCGHRFVVSMEKRGEEPEDVKRVREIEMMVEGVTDRPEVGVEEGLRRPRPSRQRPVLGALQASRRKKGRPGFINGLKCMVRHPAQIARRRDLRIRFTVLVIAVFLSVSLILVGLEMTRTERIRVDGSFGDWADIRTFMFSRGGTAGWTDIVQGATLHDGSGLYIHLVFGEGVPPGRRAVVLVMLDSDGDNATGYAIRGIGADIMLESPLASGGGRASEFSGTDSLEFDWEPFAPVNSETSGRETEMHYAGKGVGEGYRAVFAVADDLSNRDVSDYPIGSSASVLTAVQRPLAPLVPPGSSTVMRLELEAHGGDVRVTTISMWSSLPSFTLDVSGGLPLTVREGSPVQLDVEGQLGAVSPGTFLSAGVNGLSASAPAYIYGETVRSYALSPPARIEVDGAFADWDRINLTTLPVEPDVREGLDLTRKGQSVEMDGLAMLLGVRDRIFMGTSTPVGVSVAGNASGNITPVRSTKGEDVALFVLDVDSGSKTFKAEIHGKYGAITSSEIYRFDNGKWVYVSGLAAGSNRTMLETIVPFSILGSFTNIAIHYRVYGWNDLGEGLRYLGSSGGRPVPRPNAAPSFMYTPIASDISPGSFIVSWVSDQPINSSVEYCQWSPGTCDDNNFPGSPSVAWDVEEFLPNATALVDITGLSSGTKYVYRARARNAASQVSYSPATAPYPNITTKTSTSVGFNNPPFLIQPYHDVDDDYAWSTGDVNQTYFLVYLNHTGAETLVSRGSPEKVVITASNLRNDDPQGDPHDLQSGDLITFFVAGLYDDGGGSAYWVNTTASYTYPATPPLVVQLDIRTEKVPEISDGTLAVVLPVLMVAAVHLLGRFRARRSMRRGRSSP